MSDDLPRRSMRSAGKSRIRLCSPNGHVENESLPALLGNIVGGTAWFAVLAYAQVMKEI